MCFTAEAMSLQLKSNIRQLVLCRPRKMMPSDPIQAMEFAQSKGQAHKEGRTNVTLKDVAGLDATVGRLQQVVTYLKEPTNTQFKGLARPPKGILLEGDPGVGKTLIAKAIAGEAGVPFFQVCHLSGHTCGWL